VAGTIASTTCRIRAFTVTGLVIFAALFALVVSVAVPVINERARATETAQALGDLRKLASDLLNYRNDTGVWPANYTLAFTDGDRAVSEDALCPTQSQEAHISTWLALNKHRVQHWRGPYMSLSRPDPWGYRYIILLEGLKTDQAPYGWVLSAGPDGIFQTGTNDMETQGDDLGLLLR